MPIFDWSYIVFITVFIWVDYVFFIELPSKWQIKKLHKLQVEVRKRKKNQSITEGSDEV